VAVLAVFLISQPNHSGTIHGGGHQFVADIDNWRRTDRERVVTSSYDFNLNNDLAALPLTLGEWVGEDVPQTNLEAFILLEPEQYVQRLYSLPDGRSVWLSLVGSRKSKSFHSPQICYDTDGWRTEANSEVVLLTKGEIYALRLVAQKRLANGGDAEHVVLYFYLWPGFARDPDSGIVLVKVTSPVYGTLENTLTLERDLVRQLLTSAAT
jgi:hypothetical protein